MQQNLWLAVDLQCCCGAARDRRAGHAADRGGAMSGSSMLVTLNALRAQAPPEELALMNVLIYLVPLALMLGLTGLVRLPLVAQERPV